MPAPNTSSLLGFRRCQTSFIKVDVDPLRVRIYGAVLDELGYYGRRAFLVVEAGEMHISDAGLAAKPGEYSAS